MAIVERVLKTFICNQYIRKFKNMSIIIAAMMSLYGVIVFKIKPSGEEWVKTFV